MADTVTTLSQFILEEERKHLDTSGNLTLLLTHIEDAVKIIASHVRKTGLADILGASGSTNQFGEEVQKLDEFSNRCLIDFMLSSGQVCAVASEEEDAFVYPAQHDGEYVVYIDPLDGSSNIETNASIGTIFSVYRQKRNGKNSETEMFQKGSEIVACGYAIYGASTMFVYSTGNGVNGFTYDPAVGAFLLSHPQMKIGSKKLYSCNEAYTVYFDEGTNKYITALKEDGYSLRYIGSMVADIHRMLITGGVFMYPGDTRHPNGKLRLLFEVAPMAYLVKQAGGSGVSAGSDPIDVLPTSLDQRAAVVLGGKHEVSLYKKCMKWK